MTQNLSDIIAAKLGMVEPVVTMPKASPVSSSSGKTTTGWAPPRPVPLYSFRVEVSRNEYGVTYVTAATAEDAAMQWDEVDWCDCGDAEVDSVEQDTNEPDNEDELEAWDCEYGSKHGTDGSPKCSSCEDEFSSSVYLTQDPKDDHAWYCDDCCPNHITTEDDDE